MPGAEFPTTAVGWLVVLGSSLVGFLAGFLFIRCANRLIGS